jgi:hypothetical protein
MKDESRALERIIEMEVDHFLRFGPYGTLADMARIVSRRVIDHMASARLRVVSRDDGDEVPR